MKINKFVETINIPRHIKRYFIIKRIENYTQDRNKKLIIFSINFLISMILLVAFGYIFLVNSNTTIKQLGTAAAVLILISWLIKISLFVLRYEKKHQSITQLILRDGAGRNVKSWDLQRKTSLVIGKSMEEDVDIDLSGADYASLISKQHAVLNSTDDNWYIEDIGSTNGSGIKRNSENSKFRINPGKPYKLQSGDIIYIANTQILVK